MLLQSLINAVYPPHCVACDTLALEEGGLCGDCWSQTGFIGRVICDSCGTPLLGDDFGEALQCDDCMKIARPWCQGRSVLQYSGLGRTLVLRLKHGDRTDLAKPMAKWLVPKAQPLIRDNTILVPVPLHWMRLLSRRYNQSAELARALGTQLGLPVVPDAILRPRRSEKMRDFSRDQRFAQLSQSMVPNPKRISRLKNQSILLVDDVMTTGATLAAAAEACLTAGADHVDVLTLARAVKDA